MEFYLKKLKYCLIVLVIVVLTQVPFIAMRYLEDKQSPISVGGIIILYLLILLLTLFLAKREGILTFDFSFFSWSSVGLLALYYFLSILIGALGFVVMRLEGGSVFLYIRHHRIELGGGCRFFHYQVLPHIHNNR